jgi:integrase
MVDEWLGDLRSLRDLARSTIRSYSEAVRSFCHFATDPLYEWAATCEERFGTHPIQVVHEWNTAVHVQDYEGNPAKRAFTKAELQAFFDHADEQVERIRARGRKGGLPAFRDAVLFKTAYAYGLRRNETRMLDAADFGSNPHGAEHGEYGRLLVRFGEAKKGSPPKRRTVLTVFGWSTDVLDEWFTEVRPLFGMDKNPAAWPSERGLRVGCQRLNSRFGIYRKALGLDEKALDYDSFRRSYVTHLIEDVWDPRFRNRSVTSTPPRPPSIRASARTSAPAPCVGIWTTPSPPPWRPKTGGRREARGRLRVEATRGDGHPRHVHHHRVDATAARPWHQPVRLPGPPPGLRHPRAPVAPGAGRTLRHLRVHPG